MVKALTYGRAGNFYYQVAASIGYAIKHGLEFTVNDFTTNKVWNPLYLQHLVNPKWDPQLPTVHLGEKAFTYEEIPFDESWRNKNIILNGYWQSWKYFEGYEKHIVDFFGYPWGLRPEVCSVHARFGDYLTIEGKHIVVDENYLHQAIDIIKKETNIHRFRVFSDDLKYFKEHFGGVYAFEYSDNQTAEEDMIEMSCCHSHINSSSTFSVWAATLNRNPDKVVITPRQWFQEGWRDGHGVVDTKDLIPGNWIKIG